MANKKFPWKGSYRKIPSVIQRNLSAIKSDLIIVAATKKIPIKDISEGLYKHLALSYNGSFVDVNDSVLPSVGVGRFSKRNIEGWEKKREDLPKVIKTYSWESPNFGDASTYGTHTCYQDREVYPVQIFEPRMFSIKVGLLNDPDVDTSFIKFEVDQTLDKNSDTFEEDLLFCLNLLQENTGVANVYASNASREDFIGTVFLDWEVFPPGESEQLISALSRGRNGSSSKKEGLIEARIKLFNKLPVKQFIRGTGSFSAYIGALYDDNLVVFENMNYGNALYILYDDWENVSKRSRLELLKGTTSKFDRIIHKDGWEDQFETLIKKEISKRSRVA